MASGWTNDFGLSRFRPLKRWLIVFLAVPTVATVLLVCVQSRHELRDTQFDFINHYPHKLLGTVPGLWTNWSVDRPFGELILGADYELASKGYRSIEESPKARTYAKSRGQGIIITGLGTEECLVVLMSRTGGSGTVRATGH